MAELDGDVTLDISTLTLGEAAAAEMAAGMSIKAMLKSPSALRMLAIYVHELRHSENRRSWSELSSLRILDVRSSTSRSRQADPSPTSKG